MGVFGRTTYVTDSPNTAPLFSPQSKHYSFAATHPPTGENPRQIRDVETNHLQTTTEKKNKDDLN